MRIFDPNALPTTSFSGRVANNHIRLHYSKYNHHIPYLILMIYLPSNNAAYLEPVLAFRQNALSIANKVKQGDFIHIKAEITASYYKGFMDTSIIMTNWNFAEPITAAQRSMPLAKKFPFIPSNYPKSHRSYHMKRTSRQQTKTSAKASHRTASSKPKQVRHKKINKSNKPSQSKQPQAKTKHKEAVKTKPKVQKGSSKSASKAKTSSVKQKKRKLSKSKPKKNVKSKNRNNKNQTKKQNQKNTNKDSWHSISINSGSTKQTDKKSAKSKTKVKNSKADKDNNKKDTKPKSNFKITSNETKSSAKSSDTAKKAHTATSSSSSSSQLSVQIIPPQSSSNGEMNSSEAEQRIDTAIHGVIHIKPKVISDVNHSRADDDQKQNQKHNSGQDTNGFNWVNNVNNKMWKK